jgi:hypothetical protein
MLDAHPAMAIPPETHFIPALVKPWAEASNPQRALVETLVAHPRWKDFRIDAELLGRRLVDARPRDLGDALRLFYNLYAERFGKPRWGDKTPPYVRSMTLIQQLLPEARFIHVIRDGRDVTLSIKDLWWGPNSIDEAAEWWLARVRAARRQAVDLRYYLEVRYEDLVIRPEPELRAICRFLELSWDSCMLDYHRQAHDRLHELARDMRSRSGDLIRAEERTGIHALLRRPPEAGRVGRWKTEMAEPDRKRFEELAGSALQELGYELD